MPGAIGANSRLSFRALLVLLAFFVMRISHAAELNCPADIKGDSPLVTGNGFGYVNVSSTTGAVISFFAHPYSNEDATTKTVNFIKEATWMKGSLPVSGESRYVSESNVIESLAGGVQQNFFMPFDLKRNVLITTVQSSTGTQASDPCLQIEWQLPVESSAVQNILGRSVRVMRFKNTFETLVVVPLNDLNTVPAEPTICLSGSRGWAFVSVENPLEISLAIADIQKWRGNSKEEELAAREVERFDLWRGKSNLCYSSEAEKRLARYSDLVLRMGQIRQPNGSGRSSEGLINASLPPGEFFMPYVRDMSYATVAISRSGHQNEARLAIRAYYNAGPNGQYHGKLVKGPYQVSTVRYFGNGQEEADTSGEAYPNLEFDNWGEALWATGDYFEKYQDIAFLNSPSRHGTVYENARDYVARALLRNTVPYKGGLIIRKDSSIWEQNDQEMQHYAFSTAAAIAGLKKFLSMAEAMGDLTVERELEKKIELLQIGFKRAFIRGGKARGTLEGGARNDIDGALLEIVNLGVITAPEVIKDLVERAETQLMGASCGLKRTRGTSGYEKQEFLFINFALARLLLREGKTVEADAIVERMVRKALLNNGLIPELYISESGNDFQGNLGANSGAIPMVGYGAGVYLLYLNERQAVRDFGPGVLKNGRVPPERHSRRHCVSRGDRWE